MRASSSVNASASARNRSWVSPGEYINARHPSPMPPRQGRVEAPFPASGYPVGLIPEAQCTSAVLTLDPGDTVVRCSDGITEAMDPEEQEFGTARLMEALAGQVNT